MDKPTTRKRLHVSVEEQEEENNITITGRTIKKPDFFKPMSPRKQMSKPGNSLNVNVHTAKAKNSAKTKVKTGEKYPYGDGEVC
jgi:hypothetical protein